MCKGKLFLLSADGSRFIEYNESDGVEVFEDAQQDLQPKTIQITYYALDGQVRPKIMRILAQVGTKRVMMLIDSGQLTTSFNLR